jgi:NitT/TauT family transport system substrate-binding protein
MKTKIAAGFALCALAIAATLPAAAQTRVEVGYGKASEFLGAFVAAEKGLFKKHGLDVNMTFVPTSAIIPQALLAGNINIGYTSPTNLLLAHAGGLDLVNVCGANRLVADNERIALAVRPGVKIETAADLKGKKIAIPGLGSSIEIMLKKWMLDRGVKPEEATYIEVILPQMADVLKSGTVDAATAVEPVLSRIMASGPGFTKIGYAAQLSPNMLGADWMATREWATKNREAVKAFRAAYDEAIAYIRANPEEARRIETKWLGFSGHNFPTLSTEVTPADIDFYSDMLVKLGLLKQPVDGKDVVFE